MALTLVVLAAAAVAVAGTRRAPMPQVVANEAAAPGQSALATPKLPENLGEVVLPPAWTVTRLVNRVYGRDSRQLLDRVAAANPGAADLSRVAAGQRLVLPAVPAPMPTEPVRVLRVAEVPSLDAALDLIRTAPAAWPRLRLCLSSHPETGLSRDVIVDAVYTDASAAHQAVAALPAELAAKVVILEAFPPGTILYSRLVPAGAGRPSSPPGPNIVAQRAAEGSQP